MKPEFSLLSFIKSFIININLQIIQIFKRKCQRNNNKR